MPATASRIGFITQDVRNATAGPDASVVAKYGDLARDTKDPLESFFDNVADAEIVAAQRLALLSPDRRRVAMEITGADVGLGLDFNEVTPTVRMIDDTKSLDIPAAVVEVSVDFEAGRTVLTNWG